LEHEALAPTDKLHLPFRWQFVPLKNPRDGAVRWNWRADTQTGRTAMQSAGDFDTLTECMDDARAHGYGS
jgi:hypothetical protein